MKLYKESCLEVLSGDTIRGIKVDVSGIVLEDTAEMKMVVCKDGSSVKDIQCLKDGSSFYCDLQTDGMIGGYDLVFVLNVGYATFRRLCCHIYAKYGGA